MIANRGCDAASGPQRPSLPFSWPGRTCCYKGAMPTWIFFLHLLFPTVQPAAAPVDDGEAVDGFRYRGVELLFAKFDAEAALGGDDAR